MSILSSACTRWCLTRQFTFPQDKLAKAEAQVADLAQQLASLKCERVCMQAARAPGRANCCACKGVSKEKSDPFEPLVCCRRR